eukprot:gene1351-11433_t
MEILNENCGTLSNFEVFETIKEHRKERDDFLKKIPKKKQSGIFPQNLLDVEDKVSDYLKKCTLVEKQKFEQQKQFLKDIEKFGLSLNEKSQILNFPPQGLVEIHLIVSDCSTRLVEDETVELLEIIQRTFYE